MGVGSIAIGIIRQVLMGVGIAAGEAIVQTGKQLTASTLQSELAKMGVDVDPNSPIGMLLDNFKGELGFQLSYNLMSATDALMGAQIDRLREKSNANKQLINDNISREYHSKKDSFLSKMRGFFHVSDAPNLDASIEDIYNKKIQSKQRLEDQRFAQEVDAFYKTRQATGGIYAGLAVGTGVSNGAYNHFGNLTDDTKFFDAVQYLINMKKVG